MASCVVSGAVAQGADTGATAAQSGAATRKFEFHYGATINELKPGTSVRVWIPIATDNAQQKVKLLNITTPASGYRQARDKRYGNTTMYFEAAANEKGEVPIDVKYQVERRELRLAEAERASEGEATKFLSSDKLVPVNGTLLTKLFADKPPGGQTLEVARSIYNAVDDLMKYGKPDDKPWGRGDAVWACDAKVGNCTDFHAIFIGVCRDAKIPAKFEMGFPIPEKKGQGEVGGYHCWAKFLADGRWVPVDISEADKFPNMKEYYFGNLTADRVTFTTGRDLELDPTPQAGPVNFLVYPYVEVDGKPHTKFIKRFAYKDLP